ncbi:MAG: endonuclease/exonuclease/phosphatase family protein [Clostridia bacterium]|nr:endonuclease/exonuclease/phosphatase family protein [Clostridia bacterium]
MRIMTSNIWGDYFGNPTAVREDKLQNIYQKYNPDVLGMQEVTCAWYQSPLMKNLSRDYFFVGSELYEPANYVLMAIKKENLLLAKGYEQLEDPFDPSKAITWAVIKTPEGRVIGLCNTHFWWMRGGSDDEHCKKREKNAAQLSRLMLTLRGRFGCPVFAFGDMNAAMPEKMFEVYRENGIKMLIEAAEERDTACSIHGDPQRGDDGFYHGTKVSKEYLDRLRRVLCLTADEESPDYLASIDHIIGLGDDFAVKQYRVIEEQDALDATDHSPVFADIEFN